MSNVFSIISHIFLPNKCMFCDRAILFDAMLCPECEKNAPITDLSKCLICGHQECRCQNYFRYLLAPFYYDMGAENAVIGLKFDNNLENAEKLAFYMAECVKKSGLVDKIDLIIPAPLYIKDQKKRGYNQAFKLSCHVGKLIDKPILTEVLKKVKQTKKQHDLAAKERRLNLTDAFLVDEQNKPLIYGKTILLIDDVYTTGTTMNCCSKTLINAGAGEIIGLAATKTRYIAN